MRNYKNYTCTYWDPGTPFPPRFVGDSNGRLPPRDHACYLFTYMYSSNSRELRSLNRALLIKVLLWGIRKNLRSLPFCQGEEEINQTAVSL